MKAVLLAGGMGTRLGEETATIPKPMVAIGGKPILWHIMKIYSTHGITDFIVCLGYKGYVIKEYFANYFLHMSDVTFDMAKNRMEVHQRYAEPWRVTLVDTGETTATGGRLQRVRPYLDADIPFCLTYGDGVADIDIGAERAFHEAHGRLVTVCSVVPPGRYGILHCQDHRVTAFEEKPPGDGHRVNGGFFIIHPDSLDRIGDDDTSWEQTTLKDLARADQVCAFAHDGFWHPMDTLRDKLFLERLWSEGNAPWRIW
ncbi:MAG: glucose-1-phosphate cytidylyltransferase [Planctomycetes bacterium]|nr:glucose-1-phosphate cytidylyltransferase [Planctomycetota bacterium]